MIKILVLYIIIHLAKSCHYNSVKMSLCHEFRMKRKCTWKIYMYIYHLYWYTHIQIFVFSYKVHWVLRLLRMFTFEDWLTGQKNVQKRPVNYESWLCCIIAMTCCLPHPITMDDSQCFDLFLHSTVCNDERVLLILTVLMQSINGCSSGFTVLFYG